VDLAAVVADALHICRRTFDRRVAIVGHLPSTPVIVRAGRSSLEQVILNICINARDAMAATASPVLTVAIRGDSDRQRAIVDIADNGAGMSTEVIPHVGEPFFTTKPPGKGTGLGLATAIGIVRDFGGSIEFESEPGEGTTFHVTLPLADRPPATDAAGPARSTKLFAGHAGLVIDDEPMVRVATERMLTRLGLSVVTAADGTEGLRQLAEHPETTVVLVDLSMPGLSGVEVLHRIKRLRPTLPVLICSGYVERPDTLSTADAILTKPYGIGDLQETLTRVLDLRSTGTFPVSSSP
jgi:CheY-like chemotaxis protein